MSKVNKLAGTFSLFALISGAMWFGAYLSRMLLTWQLFSTPDLDLQPWLTGEAMGPVFTALMPVFTLTAVAYAVFLVSFLLYIACTPLKLRFNGWLFIILCAVLITAPFELYLMFSIDIPMIKAVYSGSFSANELIAEIVRRVRVLGGFPIVILLTYASFAYFILFKPLVKESPKA